MSDETLKSELAGWTDEQLKRELSRRDWVQEEIQRRIYRGEIEATDADGVVTIRDLQ